jgi:hypothetical protein
LHYFVLLIMEKDFRKINLMSRKISQLAKSDQTGRFWNCWKMCNLQKYFCLGCLQKRCLQIWGWWAKAKLKVQPLADLSLLLKLGDPGVALLGPPQRLALVDEGALAHPASLGGRVPSHGHAQLASDDIHQTRGSCGAAAHNGHERMAPLSIFSPVPKFRNHGHLHSDALFLFSARPQTTSAVAMATHRVYVCAFAFCPA